MKKNLKKLTVLLAAVSLISILCAARAEAQFSVSVTANEQGFGLIYSLPFIAGFGNIQLTAVGQTESINVHLFFFQIGTINFTLKEINAAATPPTLKLGYAFASALPDVENAEGDLDIPFGSIGADYAFFDLLPVPVLAPHDAKALLVLGPGNSAYNIQIDTDTMTADWVGNATTNEPVVEESLTFNEQTLNAQFTFTYGQPFVTKLAYAITVPTEGGSLFEPLEGEITLINGRYKLWIDLNQ